MRINEAGLNLIKYFEGCRLKAYQDEAMVWSIGWGDVYNVKPGDTITQEEADKRLMLRIHDAEDYVNAYVKQSLSENQFSALVSFVYNEGIGHFKQSTLLKVLNTGNFTDSAGEFLRWKKIRGEFSQGLLDRRQAEKALFNLK